METDETLDQIRDVFNGTVPNVFRRMHASGELERNWPPIRAVLVEPEPLPPEVVQALFIVLSLRCSSYYCFVLHSLTLSTQGATQISIGELARVFDMPAVTPEFDRWSRVLKLTWLSQFDGPQQHAAEYLLRRNCSDAEYQQVLRVHAANQVINSFTVDPELKLDGEPMLDSFPAELRALVPEFVRFYMETTSGSSPKRPVCTMCSVCRDVRAVDEQWYPLAVAGELIPKGVLFSHGLCSGCLVSEGVPSELH
ncbi:hypothetical protein ENSA7_56640 [Enhygromyxa salina]|uniref:Uncharacterized protein n=2 Tax=Enhygromyxa salina TaxID=215803 RepID=A0A2S9YAF3_9BACT|nr:hypothetical protein ENSA7_56640 [Enhygromyxa salina]